MKISQICTFSILRSYLIIFEIYRCNCSASLEPPNVSSQDIHDHRLRYVVSIVPSHDLINAQHHGTSVQSLAAEDSAKCAVILATDLNFRQIIFWKNSKREQ